MATFAKKAFDTALYAKGRPTYPEALYDFIFRFHEKSPSARWETAVDLGCGTGQATVELTPFKRVVGVDPSEKMISMARELNHTSQPKIEFFKGPAEKLDFLKDGSVDLIVSAQAVHWFDYPKLWPEMARILRSGGTAAFWIYSEFRLAKYPTLNQRVTEFFQGKDPETSLGPYWEQPGRSILEGHLVQVPSASEILPEKFSDFERIYFTGSYYPELPSPRPVLIRKQMSWDDLRAYLRTPSSLSNYHAKFPQDRNHPDGDIAHRFSVMLQGEAGKESGFPLKDEDTVDIDWPVALILAKRV